MKKFADLNDQELCKYIDTRFSQGESVYNIVDKTYTANHKAYINKPEWLQRLPLKRSKVRDNRIFVNMEAVINAVIANPAKINLLQGRDTPESKKLAADQEKFFQRKNIDRNFKGVMRKGLRKLFLARLIVIKKFWDTSINDFNSRALDPRKIRIPKNCTKEEDAHFVIEQVVDSLAGLIAKFPDKEAQILKEKGGDPATVLIENEEIEYLEAWCEDYTIWKLGSTILGKKPNPYWDWDGVPITVEESATIQNPKSTQSEIKLILQGAKARKIANKNNPQVNTEGTNGDPAPKQGPAYYYNFFDKPRKPYIFATLFDDENTPVGTTDFITQAIPLQEDIDETKRNITENARIVNGIIKVDATVMSQADAKKLAFEAGGIIWGKGVSTGVQRETGSPLPAFVAQNLEDSRKELDDIMAASSAFRGQREGQETKAGRLALIDQSFLRLNELVQVVEFVTAQSFMWDYQLAKVFYTEHHYAKTLGHERATEILTLMQDDMEDGVEVVVIPGKSLPEDRQFKYEQAQQDVKDGIISKIDYLTIAGYENPVQTAKNAYLEKVDPMNSFGLTEEEKAKIPPPAPQSQLRESVAFNDLPDAAKVQWLAKMNIVIKPEDLATSAISPISIKYEDLPPDGQVQAAAKAGIKLNPEIVVAEHLQEVAIKKQEAESKKEIPTPYKKEPSAKSP